MTSAVTYTIPGMHVTDRVWEAPLNWGTPDDGRRISLFAREVVDPARAHEDLPLLVYLEGGPGGRSPRPMLSEGWIVNALRTHRLILPDQRGTGRSSAVQASTMGRFDRSEDARDFLLHFRADSIVADLELLRRQVYGGRRWQTLGQSFGGFITLTYLSRAPEGLAACHVAGGLTSIRPSAADLYRHTYARLAEKNRRYFERYPDDVGTVAATADAIAGGDVRLADGDRLSVRRLQTVGIDFGMCAGFERVHWLFDEALSDGRLTDTFLARVAELTSYDRNPLYAVLQESIYGDGPGATAWAAEAERSRHPDLDPDRRPLLLTGEMMYPWMFDEIRSLRPFRAAAEALAEYSDYARLYDPERLAENDVPVAAVAYLDDLFVDVEYSLATAVEVGNVDLWVTNEYEHDGIRIEPDIVRRLIDSVARRGGPLPG